MCVLEDTSEYAAFMESMQSGVLPPDLPAAPVTTPEAETATEGTVTATDSEGVQHFSL